MLTRRQPKHQRPLDSRGVSSTSVQMRSNNLQTSYTALVSPTLASSALEPSTSSEDVIKQEKVQRHAARLVHCTYYDRTHGCVFKMDSGLQIRVRIGKLFPLFFIQTCVVGTQKNRLNETVLLSTQNTCLN